ncbi:glycosyltransferase family 4 protein [Sutcliffiella horikoshii]|uniref:glycosyltransferase family 4 protein n=1 Tax=Sutcliffiella horikoshii TaxID=79883 RepID=UPI00204101EF|nr:glycosyltransferase family 4 protein [Sutcliffiella horikoshii]MCM3617823.1 glycosyltransferase family 4 protein [Sutcliffiella horikoshii]
MNNRESAEEYIHLAVNEAGNIQFEWNLLDWRKDFVQVYQPASAERIIVRLIGWKGSLQTDGNPSFFLDILTDKNQGSLELPDVSVFKTIRVELGVGKGRGFFPFFVSEDLDLEWNRKQSLSPSDEWSPLKLIDKQKWESLSATYTYYGNGRSAHSSQRTVYDLDPDIFQESVTPEVFYSVNHSHNHFLHEEKKHTFTIVMLSWEFPPAVMGGLGKHVWELSKQLAHAGHQVLVVTPHTLGAPPVETVEGVKVFRAREVSCFYDDFHLFAAQTNMKLVEQVRILINRYNMDLIHAHDWLVGFAARHLKAVTAIPVISTIHALENGRSNLSEPMQQRTNQWEGLLINDSDVLIVCSDYMKKEVTRKTKNNKAIHIIPNGVHISPNKNESLMEFFTKKSYSHLFLYMGRLVPEKGVDTLIAAARETLETYPDCLFIIAGKGPLLPELKGEVCRLGLEKRVLFIGFLNEAEKATMLQLADMMIVPSLYEPFGIVAIEGMAAGKPVIAARTGGMAYIIEHGKTGLLFSPGNSTELSEKITLLLENPEWRIKFGRNAMDEVKRKYSWEDVREQTEAVYRSSVTTSSVQ